MPDAIHTATTPTLDIAYEQAGPPDGEPVLLLHGYPYSPRCYDAVRAELAGRGHRVIVPYLRGYGPTRYRSAATPRSGQQAALGQDVVDLLDALGLARATLVGYDWGGRGACVAAALWPERVRALVTCGGYRIQNIAAAVTPKPPEQEQRYWYQWYFHTERGRQGLAANRAEIGERLWQLWSPRWRFDQALYAATAVAFENPDFVDTVIHSYRHRYGNAPGDPALEPLERRLAEKPRITVPAVVLHGEDDNVEPVDSSEGQERQFTAYCQRHTLPGVGHCPPQEAPDAVVRAVAEVLQHA